MTPTPEMIEAGLKAAWESTWTADAGCTIEEYAIRKPQVVDNLRKAISDALTAAFAIIEGSK